MKQKRILFINPNRFLYPPVIPLGIEYLTHALREKSFDVEILDLCFSSAPLKEIEERLGAVAPHAICISVRNIDSALYLNNEFYLPELRGYVQRIKAITDAPVIIGGAGLFAGAGQILDYLGTDLAIAGPAEETLPHVLKDIQIKENNRVIRGRLPSSFCPRRIQDFDYNSYIEKGGIPGFETHKGCTSNCSFCIEAGTPVSFREPQDIICELSEMVDSGFNHFHLCDSEFNDDLDYCIEFLEKLVREKLKIKWALYMKPGNFNSQMFRLLKDSGAYLITLSVDTFKRCPEYWQDTEKIVFLAKRHGIRISIDFLAGFPYETMDMLKEAMDSFRRISPDEVVVNVFIRIYPNTRIKRLIDEDRELWKFLIKTDKEDTSYLSPVFYNHVSIEKLKEMIQGDSLFRIAGEQKGVNYQRA